MTPGPARRAALVAAWAYLAMTVIALATASDTDALLRRAGTAQDPADLAPELLTLLAGSAVVALLDLVLAGACFVLFRADGPRLARAMAATRIVYAAGYLLALRHVAAAWAALRAGAPDAATVAEVAADLARYRATWDVAFLAFAAHLVLLGLLVAAAQPVRAVLAGLLVVAGLGYLADSLIALLLPETSFRVAPYTFAGEMAFMIWLFARGGRPGRA